ncbi:hypothetical protein JYU34_003001 [Plutella xylostella]|uniref:Uncharacterized protein n=1 Tax=Plutella xylostella TaxID=51655 RepID=A0ABQ7R3N1_PLUXY|nr:hypothetical protein JYU34_003001 [Plutella xylostella]
MRETGDAFERGESHATRRGCTRKHTRAFWETSEAYSGAREMRDGGRRLTSAAAAAAECIALLGST